MCVLAAFRNWKRPRLKSGPPGLSWGVQTGQMHVCWGTNVIIKNMWFTLIVFFLMEILVLIK